MLCGLLQKVFGVVGEDVGDVARRLHLLAVDVERRIVVDALPLEADPAVEAGARRVVGPHVPLAGVGRLIAGVVQQPRPGDQLMADSVVVAVAQDFVRAHVAAGQEARAARRTERRGHEGIRENGALARDSIDVRCLHEGMAETTERVVAQIVDQDEQEIGTGIFFGKQRRSQSAERFSSR